MPKVLLEPRFTPRFSAFAENFDYNVDERVCVDTSHKLLR
jgi:hypothetical protein